MSDKEKLLEMKNISKSFVGVPALKNVNFSLHKGEVHALLGENGAGKSTLIKILGGIHHADSGEICIEENPVEITNVIDAQKLGINIIHQEIVLVPEISVAENIFLGREILNGHFLNRKKMEEMAHKIMQDIGLNIDVKKHINKLTIAQQQLVEIAKAISFKSRIIVMDEPTSSLDKDEIDILFSVIRNLKSKGVGIIFISHKLDEIFEISDNVTVFRDGEYISTVETKKTSTQELIKMMVGRVLTQFYSKSVHTLGKVALNVKGLTHIGFYNNISFNVKAGEIVGFSGLVGAGRSEIMKGIFGVDSVDSGNVEVCGKKLPLGNVEASIKMGVGLIPEDRKMEGLVLENSVAFNLLLNVQDKFQHFIHTDEDARLKIINKNVDGLKIKISSSTQQVMSLSGGNQQKVVIGKWLSTDPKVLILDEPTRGIDVGAKAEIYSLINNLAGQGLAVVIVSSEMPELINMCDRILVVASGEITGELKREDFSQEKIMYYSTISRRKINE